MLIDSHCHLDFDDFEADRDALIARAEAAGIERMVTISTRLSQFERVLAVAEAYPNVYCSVGIHPHNAGTEKMPRLDELCALAEHEKVVAIGEAGLDYHYDYAPRERQAESFKVHIEAARRSGLPLVIHARSADEDMANILETAHREDGPFPAILHCFSSGLELAERGLRLGLYLSFSGILTFNSAKEVQAAAKLAPLERLLVETDAPYLAPVPHRGKRNEPMFVADTARFLANLLEQPFEKIAKQTSDNFYRLFQKVPRP